MKKTLKKYNEFLENEFKPIGLGTVTSDYEMIFSPLDSDSIDIWDKDPQIQKYVDENRIVVTKLDYDSFEIWGLLDDNEVKEYITQYFS